ncbi:hypothetical protein ANN_02367 [Periplaneta americana]|uniref:Transposase n=1 Tax=Periplaneta americana TaxID=6978 RepID=A0ABQ8TZ28_PERAM|nr:hypothetical protein ANN_02367 [Periplaneta americana]
MRKWRRCYVSMVTKSLPSKETLRGHSDSSFRGEGYIQCCVGVRLCDMYSNQELAEIHFMYGKADGNAALARRLYQERRRPRSTTPEVQEEILEAVDMTPSISTRRVALQVNVPHTTVWRLLKEYQLYPYHLQRVQALSPADYPARVRFCQWFLQQCGVNPNFPALVLFTDEAQFTRDGITNFHNQHVWAYENPRATVPSHHQAYTNFLENTIPHVLEDTPLINRQHIHFLHDGAPAHFSRTARRYLDRRFPDRWIGRGDPISWPPRSPDLNPLDFYLWGQLKSLVYSSPVPDLESLRNRSISGHMLNKYLMIDVDDNDDDDYDDEDYDNDDNEDEKTRGPTQACETRCVIWWLELEMTSQQHLVARRGNYIQNSPAQSPTKDKSGDV